MFVLFLRTVASKLLLEDRKDARAAGVSRDKNEDPFIRRFTYRYAYFITIMTFIFIILAVFLPSLSHITLNDKSWHIINTVVGFLLGVGLSAIIQYFYGSSMGSKEKSETLKSKPEGR